MTRNDFNLAVGRTIEYYDGEWHPALLLDYHYSERRGQVIACTVMEDGRQVYLYDVDLEELVRQCTPPKSC